MPLSSFFISIVIVALLAGSAGAALRSASAHQWMQRASGAVLVGLGVRLATVEAQ